MKLLLASLIVFFSLATIRSGVAGEPGGAIPEKEIVALRVELGEAASASSSTRKRRAYKNLARDGESLLEKFPSAPNRFRVLEIIFQGHKSLLALENSDRNRQALLETSRLLAGAPDEFADLRLEADMLISERDLSDKNADVAERTAVLAELLQRYRDTPGEAKSLMMASLIAPKLEAFDLEKQIFRAMDERFAGDYDLIEWRRKHHGYAHERVLFTGTFKRADGAVLSFPVDAVGHTSVMVFWSARTPDLGAKLADIKDLQTRFPGQLDVFSFNVDQLADAGEQQLRSMGLDWTPLHLPGGRESQLYRVVAKQDPIAVRVNAHGHAFLPSSLIDELLKEVSMEQNFDDPRYLAQLQSLLIGEFLLDTGGVDPPVSGSLPAEAIAAVRACFVEVPRRYRLGRAEALSNYRKAEGLCRELMAEHSGSADRWRLQRYRIIALLGLWRLSFEPQYLASAVAESKSLIEGGALGGGVVARFCLASDALRAGGAPKQVLSQLIAASGGEDAPIQAYAAAAILAMNVSAGELHAEYRERLLSAESGPGLWPVVTFLQDQNHRFRLFKANYYMPASLARRIVRADLRSNAADLDSQPASGLPLEAKLISLDRAPLNLPGATAGKLTLLMFVEPPAGDEMEWPTLINGAVGEDSRGKKIETLGVMQQAFQLEQRHVHQEIQVIALFLSDDADRVKALMEHHAWPCAAALVPGGLANPLVRQLGVLSADRVPNIALLRPDGTLAWKLSGLVHPQVRSEGISETLNVITRGMKSNVDRYEMERSVRALEQGDHAEAVRLFSGPFPAPERPNPDGWWAPRLHGRAVAHMQLKDWESALADIDAAITAHEWVFNRKKPCVCHRVAELSSSRATILDQLGKTAEAEEARERAKAAKTSHGASRYGDLHDRIQAVTGEAERKAD